jgi:hypothetical protein
MYSPFQANQDNTGLPRLDISGPETPVTGWLKQHRGLRTIHSLDAVRVTWLPRTQQFTQHALLSPYVSLSLNPLSG